jgi:hypothetical protein
MASISREFLVALKLCPEPAYRLALRAGLHPTQLSKLIHGAERLRPNDPRVIEVGRELGLAPDDCFEPRATAEATA